MPSTRLLDPSAWDRKNLTLGVTELCAYKLRKASLVISHRVGETGMLMVHWREEEEEEEVCEREGGGGGGKTTTTTSGKPQICSCQAIQTTA